MTSYFKAMMRVGLIIPLFLALAAKGEHIIGGEMYYECNTNGTYTFTMKLYRDCNSSGAPFDNPASFAVFNDANQFVDQISSTVQSIDNIDFDLDSPCLNFPPNICVQEGTYQFTLSLDTDISSYQVVYQRCCRNQTIQNLENPGAQGLTIVSEVPQTNVAECNSSPSFNNFPPPVLCTFEQLVFDHSATDLDGDELVYSLCSPFIGGSQANPAPVPAGNPPYDLVQWSAAYTAVDPLDANPILSIDPVTGLLTGEPTVQGQFVVGVCVEEYRDGVLIGTNKRDFQFNVAQCDPVSEALIQEVSEAELCDDLSFNFSNLGNPNNEYVWTYGDPTTENDITIGYNGFYTFPDTGTYIVTLVSNPGVFCSDTTVIILPVFNETTIAIESFTFECINGEPVYSFTAGGSFDQSASLVEWDFGPGSTPQFLEGLEVTGVLFDSPGLKTIEAFATNNICEAQNLINFVVAEPPTATITPQEDFCQGLTSGFTQTSENATQFIWDFGDPTTDGDFAEGPTGSYVYPSSGLYTVSLTASSTVNCPVTVTEVFNLQTLLAPEIPEQDVFCFDNHSINFSAGGSYSNSAIFEWNFPEGTPSVSSQESPLGIIFTEPGEQQLSLTISENGCERMAESMVDLQSNPIALFQAFPTGGCAPLTVSFLNESITESTSRSFDWAFGDGSSTNNVNASHEYTTPGTYSVSLQLENLHGCIGTDVIIKTDIITVTPSPRASFDIEPTTISVLDPQMQVIDLSEGNISCTYYF
ncbi:MAG: PKD repeat protein, partial [Cryomorphaceae bacterium]